MEERVRVADIYEALDRHRNDLEAAVESSDRYHVLKKVGDSVGISAWRACFYRDMEKNGLRGIYLSFEYDDRATPYKQPRFGNNGLENIADEESSEKPLVRRTPSTYKAPRGYRLDKETSQVLDKYVHSKRMSQSEVAGYMEISSSRFSRILSGERPFNLSLQRRFLETFGSDKTTIKEFICFLKDTA